jgi:hypothetical protein
LPSCAGDTATEVVPILEYSLNSLVEMKIPHLEMLPDFGSKQMFVDIKKSFLEEADTVKRLTENKMRQ